jgi:transcription-repair coupling factor (superfamily II helicase)
MATELLDLYARRGLASGFAFLPGTPWQRALESAFLYEDTPDQRRATDEVKRDMERARPMDRLLVGDVGYGKTEVAVRAAFKAVQSGKQVAVLVPTTILAEQHGRTFRERLADYPVRIEVLSRFRSPAETRRVLGELSRGEVDVVIGTHRLLSRDALFHELGLLIVDEEHRFGVRHKERLKALKLAVDVLTLTATPIPRTLHLSLAGLRDLTLLETPPKDRSPVLTFIEPWDDALLEEALARELDRGGQVYFVHNRIETIATIAQRVGALAPARARTAVAHGQLKEQELDDVMSRFVRGEVDVLVSTMIVESGLDVPNANTMIVDRADQFGLAQLYQLRGRVGRSHRRAYCYLLAPDFVDPEAEERLRVLEHHTDLGSGYRIALRDLELRGAGNLLGGEQSGHAQAVGFDTYLRWLEETVRALKREGDQSPAKSEPPDVTLDQPAYLPDDYVGDDAAKLDLYRRLARVEQPCEIQAVREELRDRFGPLPAEAQRLLLVSELRALGAQVGLATVLVKGDEARLTFRGGAQPRMARLTAALDAVQFEAEVRRTVPLSLRLRRLGGEAVGPGLVRALTAVQQDDRT